MGELLPDVLVPGVVTITTTATRIVSANSARRGLLIVQEGSTDIRIGNSDVTASTKGVLLLGTKGSALPLPSSAAVYGIVGTGSSDVSFVELY